MHAFRPLGSSLLLLLLAPVPVLHASGPTPRATLGADTILISDVTIADVVNRKFVPGQILIKGETIASIGTAPPSESVGRKVDGSHLIALPGFVNTHTHLWQHVARSVAPNATLQEWLKRAYPVAEYLTDEELYDVTSAAASQAALSGITTVVDFASVDYSSTALETTIKAVRDAGLDGVVVWWDPAVFLPPALKEQELRRLNALDIEHLQVWVGPGPLSFFEPAAVNSAIALSRAAGTRLVEHTMENQTEQKEFIDLVKKYFRSHEASLEPRLRSVLSAVASAKAPPAVDGVSELRRRAQALLAADDVKRSDDVPDAEQRIVGSEDRESLAKLEVAAGPSPLTVLDALGALEGFLSIHSVWLGRSDMDLLERHHASVSLNPESNMYLSSGVAPFLEYMQRGINVTIGTDGAASNDGIDFFSALRATWNLQKATVLDTEITRRISPWDLLRAATINGAKAIGREARTGSIEAGKEADLVLLSTDSLGMAPFRGGENGASLIVNSAGVRDVRYVFSNGRLLVDDGRLARFEETALARKLTRAAVDAFARSTSGKAWKDLISISAERPRPFGFRTVRKQDGVDLTFSNAGSSPVRVCLAFSGAAFGGTVAPMLRPDALRVTPSEQSAAYHERTVDLRPGQALTLARAPRGETYRIAWPDGEDTRVAPGREEIFFGVDAPATGYTPEKLIDAALGGFARRVASLEPAPGGGSASAYTGLLGVSLALKAVRISTRQKADLRAEALVSTLGAHAAALAQGVDEDAAAFGAYMDAVRMPGTTDGERRVRLSRMEEGRTRALAASLETCRTLREASRAVEEAEPLSSNSLSSDVAAAALLVSAACQAASLNVLPNLRGEPDDRRAALLGERDSIRAEVGAATQRVLEAVARRSQQPPGDGRARP